MLWCCDIESSAWFVKDALAYCMQLNASTWPGNARKYTHLWLNPNTSQNFLCDNCEQDYHPIPSWQSLGTLAVYLPRPCWGIQLCEDSHISLSTPFQQYHAKILDCFMSEQNQIFPELLIVAQSTSSMSSHLRLTHSTASMPTVPMSTCFPFLECFKNCFEDCQ